jgi:small multidrug resistance pump
VAWLALAAAIALEVSSTLCLKTSDGFSHIWPTVYVIFGYTGSFACLGYALKTFDLGLVYAIWSAVGTAAIVIIGVAAFNEPVTLPRMGGIVLIVIGVVVLNLSHAHDDSEGTPARADHPRRPGAPRHVNTSGLNTNGPQPVLAGAVDTRSVRPVPAVGSAGGPWIPRQRSPYIESGSVE